jgi:EAL domain-containing protein (putative c-di-GMP-specific phosphodiesterase class I)
MSEEARATTGEGPVPLQMILPELASRLSAQGSFGLIIVDATALDAIEDEYGRQSYEEVRDRVFEVLREYRGRHYRSGDVWTLEDPRRLRLVLILERKRRRSQPMSMTDFRAIRNRLAATMVPQIMRASFPYLKSAPRVLVGHGLVIHNPIVHTARLLERIMRQALELGDHMHSADELHTRARLQDLIVHERIVTLYQPILLLKNRSILGLEALSRGAPGSGFEGADELFNAAARHDLSVELDRLCRRQALLSARRIPASARVFINALPAAIRDPEFRGKALIDFLDRAQVAPERIVIEITEKLVIENYALFHEALAYFTSLGMSFAVDDVGVGYSGLELIARLKPHFLKIDMGLVRGVHESEVNQAMVRAIMEMGRVIPATVIAEGIASADEARALEAMGVDFGQGFHLARPDIV